MTRTVTYRTPAKVNLCLLVGPREETGLHRLFTVFVPVELYDEIEFCLDVQPGIARPGLLDVRCSVAPGEANLVAKALRALEQSTGYSFIGRVTIQKHIPEAAGLGGGSSDAGLSLRVGAQLIAEAGGPVLGSAGLVDLARQVGADVAFFLDPRPMIGRGVGEILEPVTLPAMGLVLVLVGATLSTAQVYSLYDRLVAHGELTSFSARAERAERRWRAVAQAKEVASLLENDLERAAFALVPSLAADREMIVREGALGAAMSGSGPTLFGVCESAAQAQEVARRLVRRGLSAVASRVVLPAADRSAR